MNERGGVACSRRSKKIIRASAQNVCAPARARNNINVEFCILTNFRFTVGEIVAYDRAPGTVGILRQGGLLSRTMSDQKLR